MLLKVSKYNSAETSDIEKTVHSMWSSHGIGYDGFAVVVAATGFSSRTISCAWLS